MEPSHLTAGRPGRRARVGVLAVLLAVGGGAGPARCEGPPVPVSPECAPAPPERCRLDEELVRLVSETIGEPALRLAFRESRFCGEPRPCQLEPVWDVCGPFRAEEERLLDLELCELGPCAIVTAPAPDGGPGERETRRYDERSRLVEQVWTPTGAVAARRRRTFTYDDRDRVLSWADESAEGRLAATYSYSADDRRVERVGDGWLPDERWFYDEAGQLVRYESQSYGGDWVADPAGGWRIYLSGGDSGYSGSERRDACGRPVAEHDRWYSYIENHDWRYGADGRLLWHREWEEYTGHPEETYEYDACGRLVSSRHAWYGEVRTVRHYAWTADGGLLGFDHVQVADGLRELLSAAYDDGAQGVDFRSVDRVDRVKRDLRTHYGWFHGRWQLDGVVIRVDGGAETVIRLYYDCD